MAYTEVEAEDGFTNILLGPNNTLNHLVNCRHAPEKHDSGGSEVTSPCLAQCSRWDSGFGEAEGQNTSDDVVMTDLDDDDVTEAEQVLMVGPNNQVNIQIGPEIVRTFTMEGNTTICLKYNRTALLELAQERRTKGSHEERERIPLLTLKIDNCPAVEEALLAVRPNVLTRLTKRVSGLLCSIGRILRGSVVIELKPNSPDAASRLLAAVDSGELDEIIREMLKQDHVFPLIKGRQVQISVDLNVPVEMLPPDVKAAVTAQIKNLQDGSHKTVSTVPYLLPMVHGAEEKHPRKGLLQTAKRKQTSHVSDSDAPRKMLSLSKPQNQKIAEDTIEKQSTKQKALATNLERLADEVEKQAKRIQARRAMFAAGVFGAVLVAGGAAAAPFTAGASLGAVAAGGAVMGGAVLTMAAIIAIILNSSAMVDSKKAIEELTDLIYQAEMMVKQIEIENASQVLRLILEKARRAIANGQRAIDTSNPLVQKVGSSKTKVELMETADKMRGAARDIHARAKAFY